MRSMFPCSPAPAAGAFEEGVAAFERGDEMWNDRVKVGATNRVACCAEGRVRRARKGAVERRTMAFKSRL